MNERSDIDRVLRAWMADGPTAIPDRVVDVVATRIGVQRQRRAWPFQRRTAMTPLKLIAALAAAIVIAVVGYNLLPRQPSVGEPSATPTPSSAATTAPSPPPSASPSAEVRTYDTVSFEVPLSLMFVDSWIVQTEETGEVDLHRSGGKVVGVNAEIFSVASVTLPGPTDQDPRVPVPADFAGWLATRAEFGPAAARAVTIGGRAGSQFDVDLLWTASSTRHELFISGVQIQWFDTGSAGARGRFIVLPGESGDDVLIYMEAPKATFDATSTSFDTLLATLIFR